MSRIFRNAALSMILTMLTAGAAFAADDSVVGGEMPKIQTPTIHSLGVKWVITGDDNVNASVTAQYREAGASAWRNAMGVWRVMPGEDLAMNAGDVLFAGSIFNLDAGTTYEVKLTFTDPDGVKLVIDGPDVGSAEQTLVATTRSEPVVVPANTRVRYVIPDTSGGGEGTIDSPFKGLAAADAAAEPGDLFVLAAGTYPPAVFTKSGAPSQPIVWIGPTKGEAVIQGDGTSTGITAASISDVWFEHLTIDLTSTAVDAPQSQFLVFRYDRVINSANGIKAFPDARGTYVADNVLIGIDSWPAGNTGTAITVAGEGAIVANNQISQYDRGITGGTSDFDYYGNEISEIASFACSFDTAWQNGRCYGNRITNVGNGMLLNNVTGGPLYIFRNAIFNTSGEPFFVNSGTRGIVLANNTSVKPYDLGTGPFSVYADVDTPLEERYAIANTIVSNNLFVGGAQYSALSARANMLYVNFDYNAYANVPFTHFAEWQDDTYLTLYDFQATTGMELHGVDMGGVKRLFASGAKVPTDHTKQYPVKYNRLLPSSRLLVDKGQFYEGVNDGYRGKAPDIGAYEVGRPFPKYGPRPDKNFKKMFKATSGK